MQAKFVVGANNANTPIQHSNNIFRNSLKLTNLSRMGLLGKPDSGKPVIVDTSLTSKAGDTINYHFVPFADVDPIHGQDASIQGNENKFSEFSTPVVIDEVNFPFLSQGRMTQQRTILNVRDEMFMQIARHFQQYNEKQVFNRLSGIGLLEGTATYQDPTRTVDQVNGANRCIRAKGGDNFEILTEAQSDNAALVALMQDVDTISPKAIMRASVMARQTSAANPYKMQPLRVTNGKEFFLLFISTEDAYQLMVHPDWLVRAANSADSGLENDPMATGTLGIIKNVIVHESEFITAIDRLGDGTSFLRRNLLLGQNAAAIAWAQTLTYVEQLEDYDRKLGVNGFEIRGELKLNFENKDDASDRIDFGVAQLITAAN